MTGTRYGGRRLSWLERVDHRTEFDHRPPAYPHRLEMRLEVDRRVVANDDEVIVLAGLAAHRLPLREVKAAIAAILSGAGDAEEDELTIASNATADVVRAGKLDQAEQAARDLQVRFPEVHDGYDRLGMVHEARGENRPAADCYRKVIAFVREHPDDYDPGFEDVLVKLVNRLDPPGAT
jgi:hypothetical protein